jgi:ribosomal protein L40E
MVIVMAKKLPEDVSRRLFQNVFICMNCNAKIRAQMSKVKKGKIKCRKCGSKALRLKAKERRGAKA